jgi:hypothetical protein
VQLALPEHDDGVACDGAGGINVVRVLSSHLSSCLAGDRELVCEHADKPRDPRIPIRCVSVVTVLTAAAMGVVVLLSMMVVVMMVMRR